MTRPFWKKRRCFCGLLGLLLVIGIFLSVFHVIPWENFTGQVTFTSDTSQSGIIKHVIQDNVRNTSRAPVAIATKPSNNKKKCNFLKYKEDMRLDPLNPHIPVDLVAGCERFVYNRVPKCASKTMRDVFIQHGKHVTPRYTTIFIDQPYGVNYTTQEQYKAKMAAVANQRFTLVSHHYFVNWTEKYHRQVMQINIVREPSSWFISNFNFHKYTRFGNYGKLWWNKKPIGDCVANPKCFEYVRSVWGPISFLCGQQQPCHQYTPWALQMAKANLEKQYLLVGTIEKLREFNQAVEFLVPGMFTNLTKAFDDIQEKSKKEYRNMKADPISNDSRDLLKTKMSAESELYAFAKQRFENTLQIITQMKEQLKFGT